MLWHRGIPYHFSEWTTWNGERGSGYSCEYFKFEPYYITSLPAKSEEEMKARIDEILDKYDRYVELRKLHDAGCAAYYASKKPGDYTGD